MKNSIASHSKLCQQNESYRAIDDNNSKGAIRIRKRINREIRSVVVG